MGNPKPYSMWRRYAGQVSTTKDVLNKSEFVIPAKAGIQCIQSTGHRPSPVRRFIQCFPDCLPRAAKYSHIVVTEDEYFPEATSDCYGLTSREIQILRHLALGKSDGDISVELKISVKTVGTHVGKIIHKLGVNNRTHAVAKALIVRQIEMRASDSSATPDKPTPVKPDEKRKVARINTLKIKGMPVMRVDDE